MLYSTDLAIPGTCTWKLYCMSTYNEMRLGNLVMGIAFMEKKITGNAALLWSSEVSPLIQCINGPSIELAKNDY